MTIQGNNLIALVTGGALAQTETAAPPESVNAPTISAVAATDSITVSITGDSGATHTVWYKTAAATAWSDGGSRVGDGDVVISGLSSSVYHIQAYSSVSGVLSQPSGLLSIAVLTDDALEVAVRSLLYGCAYAVVGNRIYPQIFPQNTAMPAIRYTLIAAPRQHTLSSADDLVFARMQIDLVGSSYAVGRQLAEVVRKSLDNYSGIVGSIDISVIQLESEQDYYSEVAGVDALRRYGKSQDYTVCYKQEIS